jgi:hypothetical protein
MANLFGVLKIKKNIMDKLLIILLLLIIISCGKEDKNDNPCETINCLNGGICVSGICNCPTGYSGANCEILENPCANITCLNGSSCNNGFCNCLFGYEGALCENLARAKFIGNYLVNETCSGSGSNVYRIEIKSSQSSITEVEILNLYGNPQIVVIGVLNNTGGITISPQSFGTASISGSISETGIFSYTLSAQNQSDNCTFSIDL